MCVCVCVCRAFVRVHVRMRRSGFLLRPRFVCKTSKVGPLSLRFAGAAISVACVLAGSVAFVECMLGVIPSSERVRGAAQASSTGAAVTLPSEMGVGIAVLTPPPPGRSGEVAQTLFGIPGLQLPYAAMPPRLPHNYHQKEQCSRNRCLNAVCDKLGAQSWTHPE